MQQLRDLCRVVIDHLSFQRKTLDGRFIGHVAFTPTSQLGFCVFSVFCFNVDRGREAGETRASVAAFVGREYLEHVSSVGWAWLQIACQIQTN